jgi:NarL family two-component system response regulator LiaR
MGVKAYVCKRSGVQELENAIFAALEGKLYVDERVERGLKNGKDVYGLLTKREREIFTLAKSGLSNSEIAAELGLNQRTVENIISGVYEKTGISSRLELLRL